MEHQECFRVPNLQISCQLQHPVTRGSPRQACLELWPRGSRFEGLRQRSAPGGCPCLTGGTRGMWGIIGFFFFLGGGKSHRCHEVSTLIFIWMGEGWGVSHSYYEVSTPDISWFWWRIFLPELPDLSGFSPGWRFAFLRESPPSPRRLHHTAPLRPVARGSKKVDYRYPVRCHSEKHAGNPETRDPGT